MKELLGCLIVLGFVIILSTATFDFLESLNKQIDKPTEQYKIELTQDKKLCRYSITFHNGHQTVEKECTE